MTRLSFALRIRSVVHLSAGVAAMSLTIFTAWAAPDPASAMIDKLVNDGLAKAQLQPNPPASDEVFLRRIYVDIIGRIPTAQEASDFLNDKSADKRGKLIDTLLASEGYVSNWFNYWADILRVQSNLVDTNIQGAGDAYGVWLKEQLRANTPYNKLVYTMLTARGYVWDNGAVGYYMRDAGMPLDNMANTTQIFLGSRVACAQCHDHPFDQYKQRDFYEMAAYTTGVDTRVSSRQIIAEATGKKKLSRREASRLVAPGVTDVLDDLLEPLSYGTRQNPEREQRLPMDFRGDPKNPNTRQGRPGDVVKPQPVFSREKIKTGRGILENYAEWMAGPDNPTFTVVIANRLWKSAFGIGLIEPVDDIKKADLDKHKNDAAQLATNPALMSYLVQHMKASGYDMKKFLRSIYNSQSYQREATTEEVLNVEEYKFQGPVIRRMSAEQIWDSYVAMVIPEPDQRKAVGGYMTRLAQVKARAEALQEKLRVGNGKALLNYATARAKVETEFDEKQAPFRQKIADARAKNDTAAEEAAQSEIDTLEMARFDARKKVEDEHGGSKMTQASSSPFGMKPVVMDETAKMREVKSEEQVFREEDTKRWGGYDLSWIRASELPSPAPGGHFLREFGQSERHIIQAASTDSSVTQALLMLNSPLFRQLTESNTQLGKVFSGLKTAEEKRDQLFLTIVSRLPNENEKALTAAQIKASGPEKGLETVAWALLNTREFTFIK